MAVYVTQELTNSLEEIIFSRHRSYECDELQIISGYIGVDPVKKLSELPIRSKLVFGMYAEKGIQTALHNQVLDIHSENVKIFYSNQQIHTKLYIWKNRGEITSALIGSANFSTNGLKTQYRELLMDVETDNFNSIAAYSNKVFQNTITCLEHEVIESVEQDINFDPLVCSISLLMRNGEVHTAGGLNWGQNPNNHTTSNDAYLPIRTSHIQQYPSLFRPKRGFSTDDGGRIQRQDDPIDIVFDDGTSMVCLFEGSQKVNNTIYPKQLSSYPDKASMGEYFRSRLGVPSGEPVRKHHLRSYGRTDVSMSLLSEGVYYLDFSV
jgi:hypothetical protein